MNPDVTKQIEEESIVGRAIVQAMQSVSGEAELPLIGRLCLRAEYKESQAMPGTASLSVVVLAPNYMMPQERAEYSDALIITAGSLLRQADAALIHLNIQRG